MRKGFSVRWRTVIFVKMLTGFSLLSSYCFSLARFLIACPLFPLVSTDRAAWHRLIYTIQLLFWDRMAVKNCFSGQYWTRWWSFSLKRLHVCTVPTSSLSSGIYLLTIFFFHFFGHRKIQLYLQNKEFKTWRLVTVNTRYNPCFIQWIV